MTGLPSNEGREAGESATKETALCSQTSIPPSKKDHIGAPTDPYVSRASSGGLGGLK